MYFLVTVIGLSLPKCRTADSSDMLSPQRDYVVVLSRDLHPMICVAQGLIPVTNIFGVGHYPQPTLIDLLVNAQALSVG